MESIKISTTQNVDLEYEAAGVGWRILATILDGIFMAVYIFLILLIIGLTNTNRTHYDESYQYLVITIVIIAGIPLMLYHFLSETFMNAQSFGKKIVGIRVVKLDGTQPGVGSFALRSLLRIVDLHILSGLVAVITVIVSEKSQRLGDMAAGTTVIKLRSKITLKDTILYKQQSNYKIVFPQVELLSDNDVAVIKEVLDYALQTNKPDALQALADKVKSKMGVESQMSNEAFLKAVLLDYSHFQFEK